MTNEKYRMLLYRAIAALGVVLAFSLTLIIPQHMRESTDWSFQYATQNFSQGRLTVDGVTLGLEETGAGKYGGLLSQYVMIGDNRWALTEAPGYIFYLLPFYYIHAPELGNLVLAAGMAIVAYLILKHLKDEKTACLGSVLLLFTPVALAMMQRAYADTFGATAFLSIGGGLYLNYRLRSQEFSPRAAGALLFFSGLGLGLSVTANYFNALVVMMFVLHFIFMEARSLLAGRRNEAVRSLLWMGSGLVLPLAGLLIYQNAVFGSPWRFGFQFAQLPVGFSPHFLLPNIKNVTVALLVGFPLLLPAIAAFFNALYQKSRFCIGRNKPENSAEKWPELRCDILLLLGAWIAAVYGLYLSYQWTTQVVGMPFIVMARYYLPAALPLTLLAVTCLGRVPRKLSVGVTILALVWGVVFFAQAALSFPLVPHNPNNPAASALRENTNGVLKTLSIGKQNADIDTYKL